MLVNLIYNGNFDICDSNGNASGWSISGGICLNGQIVNTTAGAMTLTYSGYKRILAVKFLLFKYYPPPTNTGFSYAIPAVIYSRHQLSEYQVLFVLDTSYLISKGMMNSTCTDLAFYDPESNSYLPYWIESGCNTQWTYIWVKVTNLFYPKLIYILTGNPNPPPQYTLDDVFIPNAIFASSGTCTNMLYCNYTDNEFETYHVRAKHIVGDICNKYVDRIYWGSVCDNTSPDTHVRDRFWSRFRLLFVPLVSGTWRFAVDSDDASDLWSTTADMYGGADFGHINIARWYGRHGWCNCQNYSGSISLTGNVPIWLDFWQQEWGGNETAVLWVQPPGGSWSYLSTSQTSYYKVYARRYVQPEPSVVVFYDRWLFATYATRIKRNVNAVAVEQTASGTQNLLTAYTNDYGTDTTWLSVQSPKDPQSVVVLYYDGLSGSPIQNAYTVSTESNASPYSFGVYSANEIYVSFPWGTFGGSGWYGRYVFAPNISGTYTIQLTIRDDFNGTTANYHYKQIIKGNTEIYRSDVAYDGPVGTYEFTDVVSPPIDKLIVPSGYDWFVAVVPLDTIRAGLYQANAVANFGIGAYISNVFVKSPNSAVFLASELTANRPMLRIKATGGTYVKVSITTHGGESVVKQYSTTDITDVININYLPQSITVETDASSVDEVSLYQPLAHQTVDLTTIASVIANKVSVPIRSVYQAHDVIGAQDASVSNRVVVPSGTSVSSRYIDYSYTNVFCAYGTNKYRIVITDGANIASADGYLYVYDDYIGKYIEVLISGGVGLLCSQWRQSFSGVSFALLNGVYYTVTTSSVTQTAPYEYLVTMSIQSRLTVPIKWSISLNQ